MGSEHYGLEPSYAGELNAEKGGKPEVLGDTDYANATVAVETGDGGIAVVPEKTALKRTLHSRHIQFIALGGSIGTGLFVGSGPDLAQGGPASIIINFTLVGTMIISVVFALGELGAVLPVTGAFSTYASRFIDPAWGFAMGWNYYMQWLIVLPLEYTVSVIVLRYSDWVDRTDVVPRGVWVVIFLFIITFINLFGVKGYGEFEFAATFIKVITIIGFIIFGIVATCGGVKGGKYDTYQGAHTWYDPGAFNNGFKGFCYIFNTAAFAFAGTELVGLAAAETANPRKTLPKAAKQVCIRVVLFYVVSLLLVTFLVPYNDPRLQDGHGPSTSPFVIALSDAGQRGLASVLNTVILISTLSVANSAVYGSSRTLLALAQQGLAPRFLAYVDRQGRPIICVLISLVFGALAFLIYSSSESTVFSWLLGLSGLSTIFSWGSICLSHIRFRMAWLKQGNTLRALPWASPLGIYGSIFGFIFNVLVLVANFYVYIWPIGEGSMTKTDRAYTFFQNMLAVPVVLCFFLAWKIIKRTRVLSISEMDVHTGRRDPVPEEVLEQERAEARALPLWKKIIDAIF
ncbi:hypothetical protein MCUN1_003737 [Malassezia cuniculi]|uniref:Amino acid permease/ SLC12A domain-containing protein n=1 Tax=Malassezia cuniculi TaxID=948313 RepID=A0AAF0F1U6_9BASI|nr:hypothetical protein MCUN1_003737 [Malassezia cuniculi]